MSYSSIAAAAAVETRASTAIASSALSAMGHPSWRRREHPDGGTRRR